MRYEAIVSVTFGNTNFKDSIFESSEIIDLYIVAITGFRVAEKSVWNGMCHTCIKY